MDDTNSVEEKAWWGCRRCTFYIRKDTWSAHSQAHNLVEASLRLKLATDRLLKNNYAPLLCGVCGSPHGTNGDFLMEHLEREHLTVHKQDRDKTRFSI